MILHRLLRMSLENLAARWGRSLFLVTGVAVGTGTLALNFLTAPTSITLDDFFVRYQSITGAGHITSASGKQVSSTSGGTPVPAPGGMLGLFALALLGFGLVRRRPRRAEPSAGNFAYA